MTDVPGRDQTLSGVEARPISAADGDVKMMGTSSFVRLSELDDEVANAQAASVALANGVRGDDGVVGAGIPYLRMDEPQASLSGTF